MKPQIGTFIRMHNGCENNVRYFSIGVGTEDNFTGIIMDYTGGGDHEEFFIVNNCILPTTYECGEPIEWEERVDSFNFLLKEKKIGLEYCDFETVNFNFCNFDTNLLSLTINQDNIEECEKLIHPDNDNVVTYSYDWFSGIPLTVGNTIFPNHPRVVEHYTNDEELYQQVCW